jgi:aspartokinase
MDKIRISDIKMSSELFYLKIQDITDFDENRLLFFRDLAAEQINIEFLSSSYMGGKPHTSCCIRSDFYDQVKALLISNSVLNRHTEITPSVGLVSLFPHQFSMDLLKQSLNAFDDVNLPIYGFSSSISSITFITDFYRLKETEKILKRYPFKLS